MIEKYIKDVLAPFGIPDNLSGKKCLEHAIWLRYNDPKLRMMNIYDTIGIYFGMGKKHAERHMYYAIEKAWDKDNGAFAAAYSNLTGYLIIDRPKNSAFVATLAEAVRRERENEV